MLVRSIALQCLIVWLAAVTRAAAADATFDQLFDAASKAYRDGFYERAEKEFGELAQKFPSAERVPEAVLFQAQARFQLRQFDPVLQLVAARTNAPARLADQFQYLAGHAYFGKGDLESAARAQAQLLTNFPQSTLRLEAAVALAQARFKAGQLAETVTVLRDPASPFQQTIKTGTNAPLVAEGVLLLAQALVQQNDFRGAEQALQQAPKEGTGLETEWERVYLLTRIDLAEKRLPAALQRATNLFALATQAAKPELRARSLELEAEILESHDPQAAIAAYDKLTQMADVAGERQRRALLRLVALSAAQNQFTNAIARLGAFVSANAQDPKGDELRLALGELHLKQYHAADSAGFANNTVRLQALTNSLQQARSQFDLVIAQFTNSPAIGRAHLNRGWSLWEEAQVTGERSRIAEAQVAFQTAAERLPASFEQAQARVKLGDCFFQQKDYANAISHYTTVLGQYTNATDVVTRLFEPALFQIVQAAVELGQFDQAKTAVDRLTSQFAQGRFTDRAVLYFGEALNGVGQPAPARALLAEFFGKAPASTLKAEAQLAVARSFMRETNWPAAIQELDQWVGQFTNHIARGEAEFERAWANARAQNETNAYSLFTNFVARFPGHALAPVAQYWVADYFYRRKDFPQAEYQYLNKVFTLHTNAPATELAFQALLMAGKAAFMREGYAEARGYLTNVINHPQCPPSLLAEALLYLGDVLVQEPVTNPTNKLENFEFALNAFNTITNRFPTNQIATRAWGRIGDCHLQLATKDPKRYDDATNAYRKVIDSPLASLSAKNEAEVGLARAIERQGELRPADERTPFLVRALEHHQNVLYAKGLKPDQKPDPFWLKEAGLAAGRIAEMLQRTSEATNVYARLMQELPVLRPMLEKKIEQLSRSSPPPRS